AFAFLASFERSVFLANMVPAVAVGAEHGMILFRARIMPRGRGSCATWTSAEKSASWRRARAMTARYRVGIAAQPRGGHTLRAPAHRLGRASPSIPADFAR